MKSFLATIAIVGLWAMYAQADGCTGDVHRTVTRTTEYSYSGGGSTGASYTCSHSGGRLKGLFHRREHQSSGGCTGGQSQGCENCNSYDSRETESAPPVETKVTETKRSAGCGCCDKCTGKPGCTCGCESCKCNYASKKKKTSLDDIDKRLRVIEALIASRSKALVSN